MKLSTRYGLAGIAGLALLSAVHTLRDSVVRPITGDYLLGVLPNFAAAIAITFVLLGIWADHTKAPSFKAAQRAFIAAASISGIGLTGWEIVQRTSSRFVFDRDDLMATGVGLIVATLIFRAMTPGRIAPVWNPPPNDKAGPLA